MESNEIMNIINNGDLLIYAGNKKNKKEIYTLYHLNFKDNLKSEFKEEHAKFIQSKSKLQLVDYNPIVKQNDCIERITTKDVKGLNDLYNKFKNIDPSDKINYKNIDFFIFKYTYKKSEVLILRRHFHSNKLDRSFKVTPVSGVYDTIKENKFLTIDTDIDLLIFNDEVYIFEHIALERMFIMLEEFQNKAKSTLNKLSKFDNFDNFEEVRTKILSNGHLVRRVAKLSEELNRSTLFLENIDTTIKVIDNLELNIHIDSQSKKIIFSDDSELNELINLMQDSYYETLIGKRKGTDEIN